MNPLLDLLREAGRAALGMLALPYLYIAILGAWWHARQASTLQRQLFHVRLHSSLAVTAYRTLAGFAAGLVISLLGLGAGARLDSATLFCVWIATAALLLFRLRYICLAYAAGALGVVQAVLSWCGVGASDGEIAKALVGIDVPGLLFLAGLLHVAEGLLVLWQGSRFAVPLFLEGKRGKPVGAYSLSGLWPVPLLWLVPASGPHAIALPWTPLSAWDGTVAGWGLAAFPVLVGFTTRTETRWPERKARETGGGLIAYGLIVAGLAAGAWFWSPLAVVAAVCAFVLHEGLLLWGRWREAGRQPLYAQDGRGLTILAVLPRTPAAEMGLLAGERITKVNGARVRSKEQLHEALQLQSAFCRLEVVNREGHVKFVQRARYEGEHYQLGLILAPDEEADWVAAPRSASIWRGLQRAGARKRKAAALRAAASEAAGAAGELAAATEAEAGPEAAGGAGSGSGGPEASGALPSLLNGGESGALPPRKSKK
ncbi:PDZ domain-containing protein [Cohnella thermotolerans]|uniref:PDZ domain-containing protein n=1 Tax=Cohnella thermotolerans TaxID=329858 RepID=UPI00040DD808|nr:PDZ domain-containing protein [Cohnella thermotolerans]